MSASGESRSGAPARAASTRSSLLVSRTVLQIFGTGEQTRDLLYAEDCAEFIVRVLDSEITKGKIINAGSGSEIKIKDLAYLISGKHNVQFVAHHHPQSEIMNLKCDNTLLKKLLNWSPKITLEEGILRMSEWIKNGTSN